MGGRKKRSTNIILDPVQKQNEKLARQRQVQADYLSRRATSSKAVPQPIASPPPPVPSPIATPTRTETAFTVIQPDIVTSISSPSSTISPVRLYNQSPQTPSTRLHHASQSIFTPLTRIWNRFSENLAFSTPNRNNEPPSPTPVTRHATSRRDQGDIESIDLAGDGVEEEDVDNNQSFHDVSEYERLASSPRATAPNLANSSKRRASSYQPPSPQITNPFRFQSVVIPTPKEPSGTSVEAEAITAPTAYRPPPRPDEALPRIGPPPGEDDSVSSYSDGSDANSSSDESPGQITDESTSGLEAPARTRDPTHVPCRRPPPTVSATVFEVPDTSPEPVNPMPRRHQRANSTLRRAARYTCHCKPYRPKHGSVALHLLTDEWLQLNPFNSDTQSEFLPPLHFPTLLGRSGPHHDFRDVRWEALLAGLPKPPRLDLEASQRKCLEHLDVGTQINRQWDIDSFIAHVKSLAVHKSAFKLTPSPSYNQRITQDQKVTINKIQPDYCKHLRLGYSAGGGGYGYNTYVLFPHMPMPPHFSKKKTAYKSGSTFVDYARQQVWIDEIIIPALEMVCDIKTVARLPASWADAQSRAHTYDEVRLATRWPIDQYNPIPCVELRDFWSQVLVRANRRPEFSQPTLMIIAHGTKSLLNVRGANPDQLRGDYIAHLDSIFDRSSALMPPSETYLDLGFDDSPDGGEVTLLYKTHCLKDWAKIFECPRNPRRLVKDDVYPWMMTRDAASITLELQSKNDLRRLEHIVLPKAYNVVFNLFHSPAKDVLPFINSSFEALGFTQAEIDRWATINRHGADAYMDLDDPENPTQPALTKARMIEQYLALKARLSHSITGASRCIVPSRNPNEPENEQPAKNFGVRQEVRISLEVFLKLDFSTWDIQASRPLMPHTGASPTMPTGQSGTNVAHQPFWILHTPDVLKFISAQTNRWLLPLEALIAESKPVPGQVAPNAELQHLYHGTIAILLRTLRMTFGGQKPEQFQALWKGEWKERVKATSTAPFTQRDEGTARTKKRRCHGLDYQSILARNGVISLPQLFLWEGLPNLRPDASKKLGLRTAFQDHFHVQRDIARLVSRQDRVFAGVRQMAQDCVAHPNDDTKGLLLHTATELVISIYIKRVWAILEARLVRGLKPKLARARKNQFRARLPDLEAHGLKGLNFSSISRIIGYEPNISLVRQCPGPNSKRPPLYGDQHALGSWQGRIEGLFQFEDRDEGSERPNLWEREPYRPFIRRVYNIIQGELYPEMAEVWMKHLCHTASVRLLILLQYDNSRSHGEKTGELKNREVPNAAKRWPELRGINWIVPMVPDKLTPFLRYVQSETAPLPTHPRLKASRLDRRDDWDDYHRPPQAYRDHRERNQDFCRRKLHRDIATKPGTLEVTRAGLPAYARDRRILKDHCVVGLTSTLTYAQEFKDTYLAEEESESEHTHSASPDDDYSSEDSQDV